VIKKRIVLYICVTLTYAPNTCVSSFPQTFSTMSVAVTVALVVSVLISMALIALAVMHKRDLDQDKNFVPDSVDKKARSIKDKFRAVIRIINKK